MQTLVNFLGTYRFNWVDLITIWIFAGLFEAQHWGWAALVFVVGLFISIACHYKSKYPYA